MSLELIDNSRERTRTHFNSMWAKHKQYTSRLQIIMESKFRIRMEDNSELVSLCIDKSFADRTELKSILSSNERFAMIGRHYLDYKSVKTACSNPDWTLGEVNKFKENANSGINLNKCYFKLFGEEQMAVVWHPDPEYEKNCMNQKQQVNFVLALVGYLASVMQDDNFVYYVISNVDHE